MAQLARRRLGKVPASSQIEANESAAAVAARQDGGFLLARPIAGRAGDASHALVPTQVPDTAEPPTDIALSNAILSETLFDNVVVGALSATGGANTGFTYEIISDSSGGAFRIEGDRLIVADNLLLDFETQPNVDVRVRVTDLNGASYEEILALTVADAAIEVRYAAGDAFSLNTDPALSNRPSVLLALASGGFVAVTTYFDPRNAAISSHRGQTYDGAGNPVGGEFDLPAGSSPPIAAFKLVSGGFVLVYSRAGALRVQNFDAAGNEVGAEIGIDPPATMGFGLLDIAMLESGNFVLAWAYATVSIVTVFIHEQTIFYWVFSPSLAAQMFDPAGAPIGDPYYPLNGLVERGPIMEVQAAPDDGYRLNWAAAPDHYSSTLIFSRLFDATGAAVNGSVGPLWPSFGDREATLLESGNGLASWIEVSPDSGRYRLVAQLVDPNGVSLGARLVLVPETIAGIRPESTRHEVAAIPGGGFVVTWISSNITTPDTSDTQSWAAIFDEFGASVGDRFMLSASTFYGDGPPRVAVDGSGDLIFTWNERFVEDGVVASAAHAQIISLKDQPLSPIPGTAADDLLVGAAAPDRIDGLAGDDRILGGGGADQMFGQDGDDTIGGGGGRDMIGGGPGNDYLYGGTGNDAIAGEAGNDRMFGEGGDDVIGDDGGNDYADGGGGRDYVYTGAGDDRIVGGSGGDQLFGEGGDDVIGGDGGDDYVEAGPGRDYAYGGVGNDGMTGGAGNDRLFGEDGDDVIGGGEDDDELDGGAGRDYLHGGSGADRIGGGGGDDLLFGENGDDLIAGGDGNDQADGADGDDYVYTGAGNDRLAGGAGEDRLFGQDGDDVIVGEDGNDYIEGGAGEDYLNGGTGNDVLAGGAGRDSFAFGATPLAANLQQILDFAVNDRILLDRTQFVAINPGSLSPGAFHTGGGAADASDRIIYDPATGNLFYDSDGAGGIAAVHFATLPAGLDLVPSNFLVL